MNYRNTSFLILYCGKHAPPLPGAPEAVSNWVCWGSSEQHSIAPPPRFYLKVILIQTSPLRIHLPHLPSYTPQDVWWAKSWAWGWDQPWGICHEVEESPTDLAPVHAKTSLPGTPLQRGSTPLPALGKPGLQHSNLLCKTWPSRDRLSLSSLAQAPP